MIGELIIQVYIMQRLGHPNNSKYNYNAYGSWFFYTRLQFVYQGFHYVQVLIRRPFAKFVKVQQRIWSLCKCKG